MVRDHFQDIIPPGEPNRQRSESTPTPQHDDDHNSITIASSDKSIRNINITRKAAPAEAGRQATSRAPSRMWLWIMAGVCVLVVAFLGVLYAFSHTSISVVPHSQPVLFDKTMQFTAYPAASAVSGTLSYSIKTADFEDAEPVQATGTVHKEQKANGTITVYNNYSASPVKLLKNTRFETSTGLIFRTPTAVSVPGKSASAPGKIDITVVADGAGSQYNIGAGEKLTLPGLKGTAPMYAGVYATAAALTGGFLGEAPNVPESALAAAQSAIRSRLQQKVAALGNEGSENGVALQPVLTYTELSPLQENSMVKVRESVHAELPMIDGEAFSHSVARLVAANSDTITYSLIPGADFTVTVVDSTGRVGSDPITFSVNGSATLVATIDTTGLAAALAGRDSAAFQGIVSNFPGVDSANARIEPFWESTFPKNPSDIRVVVQSPSTKE